MNKSKHSKSKNKKRKKKKRSFFTNEVYRGDSIEFDPNIHELIEQSEVLDNFQWKVNSFKKMMEISEEDIQALEIMVNKAIKMIEQRMEGVGETYQHWINEVTSMEGDKDQDDIDDADSEKSSGSSDEDNGVLRPEDLRADQPINSSTQAFVSKSALKKTNYNIGYEDIKPELSKIMEQDEEHGDTSILHPNMGHSYMVSGNGVDTSVRLNTVARQT